MKFTVCALCTDSVITSNTKQGICKNCWDKIDSGEESMLEAYMKHDPFLETFPKYPKQRNYRLKF